MSPDAPQTFYGILQGTGVSKTLYENPLVSDAGDALGFGNKPSLADVGALLGVGDLFPELASALQIPSTDDLPLQGDGFKRTYTWTISEPAGETVGGVHGDGAHPVVPEVLLDLGDEVAIVAGDPDAQRVVDRRQRAAVEGGVDDDAADLDHLAAGRDGG